MNGAHCIDSPLLTQRALTRVVGPVSSHTVMEASGYRDGGDLSEENTTYHSSCNGLLQIFTRWDITQHSKYNQLFASQLSYKMQLEKDHLVHIKCDIITAHC